MTLRTILAALLALAALPAAAGPEWTSVARVEPATRTGLAFAPDADLYVYGVDAIPAAAIAAGAPERTVLFAGSFSVEMRGLRPGAAYRVSARFLSDSGDRAMQVSIGGKVVEARLALPPHRVVERMWDVPSETVSSGALEVRLTGLAGPNAVLSSLEALSTSPARLSPPPPAADALRSISVPAPVLYPRPSRVAGVAAPTLSLDGAWLFNTAAPAGFERALDRRVRGGGWKPIRAPGEWAMQGFTVKAGGTAGYSRLFRLPSDWRGRRVRLRFDAVHSHATVWVNGMRVAEHEGGFVPFEAEVTGRLQPGLNTLAVAVQGDSVSDTLASASQYAAHPIGGILRKVTLYAVPSVAIADQDVTTKLEKGGRLARVTVRLGLSRAARTAGRTGANVRLIAPDGGRLAEARLEFAGRPGERTDAAAVLLVRDPALWSPERPRLYTLETAATLGGRELEVVRQRVGLREIVVKGNRLLVNGRPVKLRGVCRHEVHPLRGRSLTPELCREDARLFRAANCNYIRTSHYPPSEEFLDACDELGLWVECEAALCWVQHGANPTWGSWNSRDPRLLPHLIRANLENVTANRRHPSVLIWSLANESLWTPLWARTLAEVKRLDPSRPTSFHDQCWGSYNNAKSRADIAVYHYPGEDGPARCDTDTRPVLFGEYCHLETYNRREVLTDPGIRDDWGRGFARMWELMQQHDGCLGGAIWSGIDDTFHMPDGRLIGYGPWGPIDGWRRPKPEYWHVRNAYSPIRIAETPADPARPAERTFRVENRFTFTDLADAAILWRAGARSGRARVRAAAGSAGGFALAGVRGEAVEVEVRDATGAPVWRGRFAAGSPGDAPAVTAAPAGPARLTDTGDGWALEAAGVRVEVDRRTGLIRRADAGDERVLEGGPELMLLPLNGESGGPGGNDYRNGVEPFTPTCGAWQASAVTAGLRDGSAVVDAAGQYTGAGGAYRITLAADGRLTIAYRFSVRTAVSPRQVGLVFALPRAMDRLSWRRLGQWSVYPADHIGRLVGETRAMPDAANTGERVGRAPGGSWSADAIALGTADFRSTRTGILEAALAGPRARLGVMSDGRQAVRAWVDGPAIRLLVADYNTGGSDGFFSMHYAAERRQLRPGDTVEGVATLRAAAGR